MFLLSINSSAKNETTFSVGHYTTFLGHLLAMYTYFVSLLVDESIVIQFKGMSCKQLAIFSNPKRCKNRLMLTFLILFRYSGHPTCILTPNRPVAHTSFTYRKLNMDDFSVLYGFLGYLDSTQKIFLKFLHAQGLFQTS